MWTERRDSERVCLGRGLVSLVCVSFLGPPGSGNGDEEEAWGGLTVHFPGLLCLVGRRRRRMIPGPLPGRGPGSHP